MQMFFVSHFLYKHSYIEYRLTQNEIPSLATPNAKIYSDYISTGSMRREICFDISDFSTKGEVLFIDLAN